MTNEDDFWNASSSNLMNFFDDDDSFTDLDAEHAAESSEIASLPIHLMVSNKCLKTILDDDKSSLTSMSCDADKTARLMFLGKNLMLADYCILEDKLALLDAALEIADGNVITSVVIYLSKTLSKSIFFSHLSKRKSAIKHYANYLLDTNNLQEFADLYMSFGCFFYLKDIYYMLNKDVSCINILHKKMEQFNIHHGQNLYSEDKIEFEEIFFFIKHQINYKLNYKSLVDHMLNLCQSEINKTGWNETLISSQKLLKLDDFQYEWILMTVLCKTENWDKLISHFIKSVWMLRKQTLKSVIKAELFITAVSQHKPPEKVLQQFLNCMTDNSKALQLAQKLKVHNYVVNYYIEQKDKISLLKYMENLDKGSPALSTVQTSLNNPDIKWKS